MASGNGEFGITGPKFLTAVDWQNPHHRRSIAASLVQGVYQIEHDCQQNLEGPHALAPPWWEFFGFRLVDKLVDDGLSVFFGALFEYTFSYPQQNYPGLRPPQYVMAFCGTINKCGNREQDLMSDVNCVFHNLHGDIRFQIGMEATESLVTRVGPENIWLTGHSLGSSIALLIGRRMAKEKKILLESYLFNPPFISVQRFVTSEKLKFGLRFANSVVTAGVAAAVSGAKNQRTKDNDPFAELHSWVPNLFVNSHDPSCREYAGYFEHREKMNSVGTRRMGRLATKHSAWNLVSSHIRGIKSEAVHLIPSAYLTTNVGLNCKEIKEARGIQQWWRPDLELVYKLYQYQ